MRGLKTLYLLHGFGMHHGVFTPWLPFLTKDFKVKALDLPGFGIHNSVSVKALDEIVFFLNREMDEPSIVAGWSFGGLVGIRLAELFPKKVSHLILLASTPFFRATNDWQAGIQEKALVQFRMQFLSQPEQTLRDFIALQLRASPLDEQEKQHLYLQFLERMPSLVTSETILNLLETADLRSGFTKLNCPILSLFGEKDRMIHPNASEILSDLKPHHSVIVKRATHPLFLSHPLETAQQLIHFIKNDHELT